MSRSGAGRVGELVGAWASCHCSTSSGRLAAALLNGGGAFGDVLHRTDLGNRHRHGDSRQRDVEGDGDELAGHGLDIGEPPGLAVAPRIVPAGHGAEGTGRWGSITQGTSDPVTSQ